MNYASGSPWEDRVGYSRAVRVGPFLEVSGTVASDEQGQVVGPGDPYQQTRYIYRKIEQVLRQAGASLEDVVRVRMFVTDISRWQDYGRAHHEFFAHIKPCNTMVEVSALIDPAYLVEIEVSAVLDR